MVKHEHQDFHQSQPAHAPAHAIERPGEEAERHMMALTLATLRSLRAVESGSLEDKVQRLIALSEAQAAQAEARDAQLAEAVRLVTQLLRRQTFADETTIRGFTATLRGSTDALEAAIVAAKPQTRP